MGSRTLPIECEHGKVYDWGDFGGDDSEPEPCPECDAGRAKHCRQQEVRTLDSAAGYLRKRDYGYLADRVEEVAIQVEQIDDGQGGSDA